MLWEMTSVSSAIFHYPIQNMWHESAKKFFLSKLSKLGSHILVTKVENLVTKQKMLLSNFKRVGEKEDVLFQEQSKLSVILRTTWIFFAQSEKLSCFWDCIGRNFYSYP